MNVPVSQEDAIFRLSLSNRPFDVDALSEDKRKIKRFLNNNKSRTQSIEPESTQMPIMNPFMLQQAQQLQQQQQQQQQMHLQQQILLQQQQAQQQQQLVQAQQQRQQPQALLHQPLPPSNITITQPHMLIQPPLYDMNAFNGRTLPPNNLSPVPESTTNQSPQPPPLTQASQEFYALFREAGSAFLNSLKLSSNSQFQMSIPGKCLGHSIILPSKVHALTIEPEFPEQLKPEDQNRLSIVILQNNVRLNPPPATNPWTTVPLLKGTNLIKINITANVSQPDSALPEYKSQTYHLFVTQTW